MAYFRGPLIRLRASCKRRRLVFTACHLADKDLTTVANNSARKGPFQHLTSRRTIFLINILY